MEVYMSDYEDILLDEDTKKQFLSSLKNVASTNPEQLTILYTVSSLVMGIKAIDKELGDRKSYYDEVERKKREEGYSQAEQEHFNQVQMLTVRELNTLYGMAERVETALRHEDYIYSYETSMPEISDIIWKYQKKGL